MPHTPLPATCHCIEISGYGGPEVLKPVKRATPVPVAGEVLIRVAAAGINRPDLMQRMGFYPPPAGVTDIPGLELAGEVVALGEGVSTLKSGDKVCALVAGGAYAEYCVAAASLCLPIPDGLSLIEAAALPETCFTVWSNLFERGRLQAGERVLIQGGSGGIGSTAIQLARAFGATVYATAGSPEKCRFCTALGAIAIHYRTDDFVEVIKADTQGAGVNVILDSLGGRELARHLDCLALEGRLLLIGVQLGSKTDINLLPVLLKRLSIIGSTLRPRSLPEKTRLANALREQVWPLLQTGQIRPIIDSVFPMTQAHAAHQRMESSQHQGKIVLSL